MWYLLTLGPPKSRVVRKIPPKFAILPPYFVLKLCFLGDAASEID
ncbi:hypothetical protein IMCC12053_816 [Celeribacter marinus]|uniref:Uncharacterized protein n=1 Tax=Celeribacter marinus TaxID=1397108 RepID=A0A0N9ZN15_9RHOB|nr:hypothetical protein IMCC12053_816 [Celeribacter marinus]